MPKALYQNELEQLRDARNQFFEEERVILGGGRAEVLQR